MARIDDISRARQQSGPPRPVPETIPRPSLALVGISHQSAPFAELARAALDPEGVRRALRRLAAADAVREGAVVATCNRTEIYLLSSDREAAVKLGHEVLRETGLSESGGIYVKYGQDLASHLFRVAAGIDSLMIGEVQILGQVKQALSLAEEEQASGTVLGKLFGSAFHAGKRVRSETEIGAGAVSVSFAALGLAQKIFSDLSERTLLVIGAGQTSSLTARHFADAGVGNLLIVNRTPARAAALADAVGGRALPYAELPEALREADIAVSATASPRPIIDYDMTRQALRKRGNRRLVLIDIALPRDVDPRVNDLGGVFVHDMAALDSMVQRNLDRRRRELPKVEVIIAEEVDRYQNWQGSLRAGPTIRDLRLRFETVRAEEIAGLSKHLDDEDFRLVERATRLMINRLLHQPQVGLRRPQPGSERTQRLAAVVRELFGLDRERDDRAPTDGPGRLPGAGDSGPQSGNVDDGNLDHDPEGGSDTRGVKS